MGNRGLSKEARYSAHPLAPVKPPALLSARAPRAVHSFVPLCIARREAVFGNCYPDLVKKLKREAGEKRHYGFLARRLPQTMGRKSRRRAKDDERREEREERTRPRRRRRTS